jgi:outer membrane protein TolC
MTHSSTFKVALFAILFSSTTAIMGQPVDLRGDTQLSQSSDVVALSMDDAVELAQTRSFRTARSQRNLEMSQLRYKNARSAYYPRANTGFHADQSARGFSYASDRFEFRGALNGDVSMPIDLFGTVKRQVSQADISREMSRQDIAQSALEVALEAQNNYLNALRAQNIVDAEQKVVAEIEALIERSRATAPGAVPFLQVELGNAQQSLTSSRTIADQAQDGLKQTLRLPPETRLRLTTSVTDRKPPLERDDLLQRALQGRPDVQQSLQRIRQAEISQRQVADYRKPSIRAGGFFNENYSATSAIGAVGGNRDQFRSHGVGLNLNVPFLQYDNGQLRRHKRVAAIQTEQAIADSQELRERVAYELRQALLGVERAENRIMNLPDRKQAYDALKRAEQQMLSAPEGQAQALLAQVTNARSAWRAAETASAEAYIDYNVALFRLKRTLGERHSAEEPTERITALPTMSVPTAGTVGGTR